MGIIGKSVTTKVQDGLRKIKGLFFGRTGVNNAYECAPYGTDANPIKDTRIIQVATLKSGRSVVIGCINKDQKAAPGEHRIYATDTDGNTVSDIWLDGDGNVLIHGDADNMVRYSPLEEEIHKLRDDFNALVNAYNTHLHTSGGAGNVTTVPTSTANTSSADISGAKIENVKTN